MAIEDIKEYLSYGKCDCPIDYREDLGIVNGICPKHPNSTLYIKGMEANAYIRLLQKKKVDSEVPKKV